MSLLNNLPDVESLMGIDLRTGAMMIAVIGIIHPMAYGCTCCIPMSYLLLTIWILVALYFAASIILMCGVIKEDLLMCSIWIWYTIVFVIIMLMMMILLAIVFTSRKQTTRVLIVISGILYYIMTIYFILVVNSYCGFLSESD